MDKIGYFRSAANQLSYSTELPVQHARRTGIIFVHAADGNRLGPHRMFVELARMFGLLGYPALRFDLSGCGDSTGEVSQQSIDAEVFDVAGAVKFFTANASLDNVVLFGISRGARVCYTAMARYRLPLKGLILLSTPVSSGKAGLKSFANELRQYIYKLKEPSHLWKLLRGRANIARIWTTLVTAGRLADRYKTQEKTVPASKAPVLFIYAGHDSIAEESSRYYAAKCRDNILPYDCRFIAEANHSFFHYRWKEQIFDLSKQWLERISEQVVKL